MVYKNKILIMTDWFYPAFRAGGPIRSCVNFIDYFYNDFQIFLLCSDRDAGSEAPLSGIETNQWVNYEGKALVWYAGSGHPDRALLKRIISEIAPDYLYLNSLYSLRFSLLPLWLRRVGVIQTRIIMAPRGMLKKSALSHKPVKKKIFLFLFRLLSFPSIIRFQATDQMELEDIHNHFPHANVMLTPNVPAKIEANDTRIPKVSGSLRLLFVSRVHPIKNLDLVLKALQKVKGHVEFIIIGSVEDQAYWKHCCTLIDQLPAHISVEWKGELPHERIVSVMQQYHLLVLPTKGENFGHVIFEALSAGRPVLISDQTPWRQLAAQHAGWDLSLTEPNAFTDALNAATAWDQNDFNGYIHGTQSLAASYLANAEFKERYFNLFN